MGEPVSCSSEGTEFGDMGGGHKPVSADKPLRVLVATPLGRGGKGGIDRLMDAVRDHLTPDQAARYHVSFGVTRGPYALWLSPFYLGTFLLRLAMFRVLSRPGLLHINLSSDGSTRRKVIVGHAAHALGIPYVVHLHGSRFRTFFDEANPSVQAAARLLFARARRVIVLGRVWKDFIADHVPDARDRIAVLPNAAPAIPSGPPRQDAAGPVVLFLGRVGVRKGVPQLIDALQRISGIGGWRAVIAGDGDVAETRAQVASLGLSSRVDVPGWVEPDGARALLASSDILVLPSFDENLPMSVIEGMSGRSRTSSTTAKPACSCPPAIPLRSRTRFGSWPRMRRSDAGSAMRRAIITAAISTWRPISSD
jgi:glycosyltransferase involved in cell wall biosynthesis